MKYELLSLFRADKYIRSLCTANGFPGRYKNFDFDPSDIIILISWDIAKKYSFVKS